MTFASSRPISRRRAAGLVAAAPLATWLATSCGEGLAPDSEGPLSTSATTGPRAEHPARQPAEGVDHQRTWMCWPASDAVWGDSLTDVQAAIALLITTITDFEPVVVVTQPDHADEVLSAVGDAGDVEVLNAPVDDLWARDTLPIFAPFEGGLTASHPTFNGWGNKHPHRGDAKLAAAVADALGIDLFDAGVVGEGGGIDVDGRGTAMAARSSWINPNRNPDLSAAEIETALLDMVGADQMVWVDGVFGEDITDGQIGRFARFVDDATIVVDAPASKDDEGPWADAARHTADQLADAHTHDGGRFQLIDLPRPAHPRVKGDDVLASYTGFYVCNSAVLVPQFGDEKADDRAVNLLGDLFPGRDVTAVDVDVLVAGGATIHSATREEPAPT